MTRSARLAKYGPFAGGAVVAPRPLVAIAATRSGGVPQNRIRQVFADLMAPLQALHDQGRVHGAISNATIGLDEWGHALLLVPALSSARSAGDNALQQGRASGFNAFEQYTDDPTWVVGPWTDIYALCAVGCALVTGVAPQSAIDRCVRDDYISLEARGPKGYDREFLRALDVGLTLFHRDRPRSLEAFAVNAGVPFDVPAPVALDETQLRENIAMLPHVSVQDPMFHTYGRPGRSRVPLAIGLLAIIVSAALIFFWTRLRWTQSENWPAVVAESPQGGAGMRESFRPVFSGAPTKDTADVHPPSAGVSPGLPGAGAVMPGTSATSSFAPGMLASDLPAAQAPLGAQAPRAAEAPLGAESPGPDALALAAPEIAAPAAAGAPAPAAPASTASAPAAAEAGRPAKTHVEVDIDIRPWGEVYVDGASHGVSPPLRSIRLTPGRHKITIRNPGAPAYRTTITVRAGKPASIAHSFQ